MHSFDLEKSCLEGANITRMFEHAIYINTILLLSLSKGGEISVLHCVSGYLSRIQSGAGKKRFLHRIYPRAAASCGRRKRRQKESRQWEENREEQELEPTQATSDKGRKEAMRSLPCSVPLDLSLCHFCTLYTVLQKS
jgi:hypothetical protein